jgi:hypothetical protein
MKNKIFIKYLLFLGLIAAVVSFNSCKNNDNNGGNSSAPVIKAVYLEDANSSVPDRPVDFVRLGQTVRIEGESLLGVTKLIVNGYELLFNPALMTDNSMWFQVSSKVPTVDAPDDVRNTIRLEKGSQYCVYNFDIRSAAPSITNVSHTMPRAGDEITITGSGLQDVAEVLFPGDIKGTNIISDDVDGKWCKVTVPGGITTSGSIFVTSVNGGAYSPSYFNFKEGVLQNFDDVSTQNYTRGAVSADLSAIIPSTSGVIHSQGTYRSLNTTGNVASAGVSEVAAYWMKADAFKPKISPLFPITTPAEQVGIQMDIYVEGEWNSGYIRMVMADGYGVSSYCMLYAPVYSDGKIIPFDNPGGWFTITLPFSLSSDFGGKSLGEILDRIQLGATEKYNQWGPWFCNDKYNDVDPANTNVVIYFDNIRVVSLVTPAYSDFPD